MRKPIDYEERQRIRELRAQFMESRSSDTNVTSDVGDNLLSPSEADAPGGKVSDDKLLPEGLSDDTKRPNPTELDKSDPNYVHQNEKDNSEQLKQETAERVERKQSTATLAEATKATADDQLKTLRKNYQDATGKEANLKWSAATIKKQLLALNK